MKRVLRSCITPLPRFLSTRGLAALVLVLVAGTALSVHEYLQTARTPRAAQARTPGQRASQPGEVRAAERTSAARSHASRTVEFVPANDGLPASGASSTPLEASPRPATLYRPDDASSGT